MTYTDEPHPDTKSPIEDPPSYSPPAAGPSADERSPLLTTPQPTVLPENIHAPQPPFSTDLSHIGPDPTNVICPRCHYGVQTVTKTRVGVHAGVWAGICCLACGFIAAVIPLIIPKCQDVEHTCPHCGFLMARYNRGSDKVEVFPVEEAYLAATQEGPSANTELTQTDGVLKAPKTI